MDQVLGRPLAMLWALAAARSSANPDLVPAEPSYVQRAEWGTDGDE